MDGPKSRLQLESGCNIMSRESYQGWLSLAGYGLAGIRYLLF